MHLTLGAEEYWLPKKQGSSMERFSVERMLTLQIQGVLHRGVEDHLASSLTTGKSRAARTLPRNIRFDY